jgi:hypothetical protein
MTKELGARQSGDSRIGVRDRRQHPGNEIFLVAHPFVEKI